MGRRPKVERVEPLRSSQIGGRFRMTPHNMDRLENITTEQVEVVQRVCLSIYTDMSNNGFSLREALAAVYLSGVSHAFETLKSGE